MVTTNICWPAATATTIATTVVTKTQIGGDITLPSWARQIVKIRPTAYIGVPAINEAGVVKFSLESDDIGGLSPFEVLGAPISSTGISALGAPTMDRMPAYYVHSSCSGGNRLRAYAQILNALTPAVIVAMEITISDQPPNEPQKHAKVGTLTTMGAAATATPGTSYQITGGSKIIELCGVAVTLTTVAADDIGGLFKWTSSEFVVSAPVEMMFNPSNGPVGATGQIHQHLERSTVDLPISSPCTLQDYCTLYSAAGTAGRFVTAVVYQ